MNNDQKSIMRRKLADELTQARRRSDIADGDYRSAIVRLEERKKDRDAARAEVGAIEAAIELMLPTAE